MPKKAPISKSKKGPSTEELIADIQRIQAEFVNFKARSEKERFEAINIGKENTIFELLPVFDNIQRAFQYVPGELVDNPWVKGIISLDKQLNSSLQSMGLDKIETIGKPFDPNTMEAVSVEDGDGEEIVSEEIQPGYMLNNKVVRPALVKVYR